MDQPQHLLRIVEALHTGQVRYVMIGGIAMRLHGSSHITDDVDICYGRDALNLQALAGALAPYQPSLRGAPAGLPFVLDARSLKASLNFTLSTTIGALDIPGEPSGVLSFDDPWERSIVMQVRGLDVHAASIENLIAMKRAAGRPKDQSHILELQALLKLTQDENGTNG